MKNTVILLILALLTIISCNSKKNTTLANPLNGSWELTEIPGSNHFQSLYANKKPMLIFDFIEKRVSGNSSCNSFGGTLHVDGTKIHFKEPMVMTKMFCEGDGETTFMTILDKVDNYAVTNDGKQLHLKLGNTVLLKFDKIYERVE